MKLLHNTNISHSTYLQFRDRLFHEGSQQHQVSQVLNHLHLLDKLNLEVFQEDQLMECCYHPGLPWCFAIPLGTSGMDSSQVRILKLLFLTMTFEWTTIIHKSCWDTRKLKTLFLGVNSPLSPCERLPPLPPFSMLETKLMNIQSVLQHCLGGGGVGVRG